MAVACELVVLVRVPVIYVKPVDCVRPPVMPAPVGATHVYLVYNGIVPFTPFVGVTLNAIPLQVMLVIKFTIATGLTVTVTVNVFPTYPSEDVGVTV